MSVWISRNEDEGDVLGVILRKNEETSILTALFIKPKETLNSWLMMGIYSRVLLDQFMCCKHSVS